MSSLGSPDHKKKRPPPPNNSNDSNNIERLKELCHCKMQLPDNDFLGPAEAADRKHKRNYNTIMQLVANGLDLNKQMNGNIRVIDMIQFHIFRHAPPEYMVNLIEETGASPTSYNAEIDIVSGGHNLQYYLDKGVSPDAKTACGEPMLLHAFMCNAPQSFRTLLYNGASLSNCVEKYIRDQYVRYKTRNKLFLDALNEFSGGRATKSAK